MIKASELRLLNWVYFPGGHYPHYAQATDFEMLEYFSRNGDPISITPEILESAGFEKGNPIYLSNGYTSRFILDEIEILISEDNYYYGNGLDNNEDTISTLPPFKYVHQLQNLYFALTGSELEIKAMTPSASQTS